MGNSIYKKVEDRAEREALKLLGQANADYRNHQVWKILGINPEDLSGAVAKLGRKGRYDLKNLKALKQDLELQINRQVPEARMVRVSSLAGLQFINHLKV